MAKTDRSHDPYAPASQKPARPAKATAKKTASRGRKTRAAKKTTAKKAAAKKSAATATTGSVEPKKTAMVPDTVAIKEAQDAGGREVPGKPVATRGGDGRSDRGAARDARGDGDGGADG